METNFQIIKKQILLSMACLICMAPLMAQTETTAGSITPEMLAAFRAETAMQPSVKAIRNAVTSGNVRQLVQNNENRGRVDDFFTYKVKVEGISDQKSSGRCWLFASLNAMRGLVIEKHKMKSFFFSQNYSFFFDQLEKSNLFLEEIIHTANLPLSDRKVEWLLKNPAADGGVWSSFVNIVEKYGVVPASVMPDTKQAENTGSINNVLSTLLRSDALKLRSMVAARLKPADVQKTKTAMLSEVYRVLSVSLGEPPLEFSWRFEDKDGKVSELMTYTPQSFYKEFIDVDLHDYVQLMDDPSREYNKVFEIEYDRNTYEGVNWKYLNIPVDQMKASAVASIRAGEAMYYSCDVGKQLDRENGILDLGNYDTESLFGITLPMTKKERIQTFESSSSHGMSLCGVDLDEKGNPVKWLVENSWGKTGHDGFLIMTDRWFDAYMFRLIIHKKYVDPQILKLFDQPAILLPAWDPMFAPVE
ncbi:MAG TPA: aminopeptidase [Bacteroidales bacterium]|nr:MAG: hypothetical protein A2X11_05845 [Bacteroidetes bacterium GWE2_42_24]OFY31276.1 MAG: hypothetical protein A2X09_10655 [Bacteroidetes bacterium GWF2_43_11]HBZ65628.1 aminopeptidase [Bacteroidales bacterium]